MFKFKNYPSLSMTFPHFVRYILCYTFPLLTPFGGFLPGRLILVCKGKVVSLIQGFFISLDSPTFKSNRVKGDLSNTDPFFPSHVARGLDQTPMYLETKSDNFYGRRVHTWEGQNEVGYPTPVLV